jgi:hypothetical protein
MKIVKHYGRLLLVGGMLVAMASCKKDAEVPALNPVEINLPNTLSLSYGEQQQVALPASLLGASDIKIAISFDETANIQITQDSKLHDKLAKAVIFDQAAGKLTVNTLLLYPNGSVSSVNGSKIPDSYKIAVSAKSAKENFEGKQTIDMKIRPSKLTIKGLDNQSDLPFAYVLYGDPAIYDLEVPQAILTGATWDIANKATLGTDVSYKGNQLQFSSTAGDKNKKEEKSYDVVPVLQKDGFIIASRTLRVVFIPQIKFFYGTYYADLNLTILLNQLHIALSNGYLSAIPTLYPEKYKSAFAITGIEKDGQVFSNTDGIIEMNSATGSVTVKKNTILTAGAYKITAKATTTTGLEFTTSLTLNMSSAE